MNHDDTIYCDCILVLSSLVGVILLLTKLYLFGMCIVYGFADLFQSDTPLPISVPNSIPTVPYVAVIALHSSFE